MISICLSSITRSFCCARLSRFTLFRLLTSQYRYLIQTYICQADADNMWNQLWSFSTSAVCIADYLELCVVDFDFEYAPNEFPEYYPKCKVQMQIQKANLQMSTQIWIKFPLFRFAATFWPTPTPASTRSSMPSSHPPSARPSLDSAIRLPYLNEIEVF